MDNQNREYLVTLEVRTSLAVTLPVKALDSTQAVVEALDALELLTRDFKGQALTLKGLNGEVILERVYEDRPVRFVTPVTPAEQIEEPAVQDEPSVCQSPAIEPESTASAASASEGAQLAGIGAGPLGFEVRYFATPHDKAPAQVERVALEDVARRLTDAVVAADHPFAAAELHDCFLGRIIGMARRKRGGLGLCCYGADNRLLGEYFWLDAKEQARQALALIARNDVTSVAWVDATGPTLKQTRHLKK